MTIERSFIYKKNYNEPYKVTRINNNELSEDVFIINNIITKNDNETIYNAEIKNTAACVVNIGLDINYIFDHEEEIAEVKEPFENFNYKSFSPLWILVITNKRQVLIKTNRSYAYKKKKDKRNIRFRFFLDAPFLHPTWNYQLPMRRSSAAPMQPAGTTYHFSINSFEFDTHDKVLQLQQFLYPYAYSGAFILTDHCDFDTTEKLTLFLYGNNGSDGWLDKNLKITKGVFSLGALENELKKNDSLEDAGYAELISVLHKDGSEIAPHALKSKGQLSGEVFHAALENLTKRFHPQTWIDHGSYIKYCYSQEGKENPDYKLIDTLKQLNYNNLWSFHDVNIDAAATLNIFSQQTGGANSFVLAVKYFLLFRWGVALHYLRSIVHRNYSKNIFFEFLMYAMARSKNIFINIKARKKTVWKDLKAWAEAIKHYDKFKHDAVVPYNNRDVLNYCSPLYTDEHKPMAQYKHGDLLLFSTFETTHLLDIYSKRSLQKLINKYGTHIAHTYILNDLPYLNGIIKKKKNKYFLAHKWIQFMNSLSKYISDKSLWNPNMGEYAAYIIKLQGVSVHYNSASDIVIRNNNGSIIGGYTFMIPATSKNNLLINKVVCSANKTDKNFHFFSVDLPAEGSVQVNYN